MSTLTPGEAAPAAPVPRSMMVRSFFYSNCVIDPDDRWRQIDRYEAHWKGTEYSHLSRDWSGLSADQLETVSPSVQVPFGFEQPMVELPARQKRPTAPLRLTKAVVERFTGLLFSESRRPQITVEGDPETEGWLKAAMEASSFWARVRQARSVGGGCGSVLVTVSVRAAQFNLEVHNPKHCTILWRNKRRHEPEAVLLMWKHTRMEEMVDPKTRQSAGSKPVTYLYRRIISEQEDVVYRPVRIDGKRPSELRWDVEHVVQHDLGFFPGVWVQNLPVLENHDGDPDCMGGWQILDTIDRLISQMNQGTLYNMDPTLVLSYDHKEVHAMGGVKKGSLNALTVGAQGDAKYLEITGAGVEIGLKLVDVLRQRFLDLVRCVFVDPSQVSGAAQSAKAIEYMYAPMLEKADDLRAQWGDTCVVPLLRIMEKIGRYFAKRGEAEGRPYRFLMPKRKVETPPGPDGEPGAVKYEDHALGAEGGYIRCQWGPYFSPTEQDDKQRIDNAVSAKAGGLIDDVAAVKHVAKVFEIASPEALASQIREAQAAEMEQAMAQLEEQSPFGGKQPAAGEGGKP